MNPENTIANLGTALGLLYDRGHADLLVDSKWQRIYQWHSVGDNPSVHIEDVLLLLQAEEIR